MREIFRQQEEVTIFDETNNRLVKQRPARSFLRKFRSFNLMSTPRVALAAAKSVNCFSAIESTLRHARCNRANIFCQWRLNVARAGWFIGLAIVSTRHVIFHVFESCISILHFPHPVRYRARILKFFHACEIPRNRVNNESCFDLSFPFSAKWVLTLKELIVHDVSLRVNFVLTLSSRNDITMLLVIVRLSITLKYNSNIWRMS